MLFDKGDNYKLKWVKYLKSDYWQPIQELTYYGFATTDYDLSNISGQSESGSGARGLRLWWPHHYTMNPNTGANLKVNLRSYYVTFIGVDNAENQYYQAKSGS